MYTIKELFYTLQGEGVHSGRPAVFCRFTGCNLWSGQEKHRASAACTFCDTDFLGTDGENGGKYPTAQAVADKISQCWPASSNQAKPYVVFTGGEPLLQLDEKLIEAMHKVGFEVGIETNGTLAVPTGVDWICLSPKQVDGLEVNRCHELKLVYPQPHAMPEQFDHIEAEFRFLSPMMPLQQADNAQLYRDQRTRDTIAYCLRHPQWRLNLQSHKVIAVK